MKIEGRLCNWNSRKLFGVVEVRIREGVGYRFEKYFLTQSHVVYSAVEPPEEGCIVLFTPRTLGKLRPGLLPTATEAEIFESLEQMKAVISEKGGEGSVS